MLDVVWLKQNCKLIHYFGLGFIQLKINNAIRFHFYTEELPAIVGDEDVHNHRYDFTSEIIKGSLTQEIYRKTDGDDYVLCEETCQAGVECHTKPVSCGIKLASRQVFVAGSEYWIDHDTFHRVYSTNAITRLTRTDYKKDLAQVIRPKDTTPVCPFSQKISEEELWCIVGKMIIMR